ncbi:MAG: hypothetical protein AAGJ18_14040 [Bacteroidota bacterium]
MRKQLLHLLAYLPISLLIYTFLVSAIFAEKSNATESNCVYTYVLEAKDGAFVVSLLSNKTIEVPFNTTATAQVTLKVPTGSFKVNNLKNLVEGVEFSQNGQSIAPEEAPDYDYIVFGLASLGTRRLTYTAGEKLPLFSFENSGKCTGNLIELMENFTDPFYPPNKAKANVSQQITVAATGSDMSIVCIDQPLISDCGKIMKKKRRK